MKKQTNLLESIINGFHNYLKKAAYGSVLGLASIYGIANAGIEKIDIPANGSYVYSSILERCQEYEFSAEGMFGVMIDPGGNQNPPSFGFWDTQWSATSPNPWYEHANVLVDDIEYIWQGTSDGVNYAQHTFSSNDFNHKYLLVPTFMGRGKRVSFRFYDDITQITGSMDMGITINIEEIPEPSTIAFLGLGSLVFLKKSRDN